MASAKNVPITPAAADLGLGGQLKQQLDDAEMQRRKKLLQQAQNMQNNAMASPASQMLLGNPMSMMF